MTLLLALWRRYKIPRGVAGGDDAAGFGPTGVVPASPVDFPRCLP